MGRYMFLLPVWASLLLSSGCECVFGVRAILRTCACVCVCVCLGVSVCVSECVCVRMPVRWLVGVPFSPAPRQADGAGAVQ